MKLEISEIENKEVWESFLLGCKEKTFLQSWNWGEFQKMMGNKIWRFGVYDSTELASVCLVSLVKAKRGTFLLIQHGPNVKQQATSDKQQVLYFLLEKLKEIARGEKADFIRLAPLLEKTEENQKILDNLGFRKSPMHASAYEATWKLDLSPSEDDLLKNMRKTTRYLIKQAQNNPDIVIEKSVKVKDLELYQNLNREVARRQKFVPFSSEYIKKEFAAFSGPARNASPHSDAGGDNQVMLFFGKYKNEVAAAALIIFWSGIGFYHQAASDSKYAKLSIPYLLQWSAVKEAKKRGCVLYDFWGFVDPGKNPKHPWAGPTLFKMGFGGRAFAYLKTQDFPVSRKYWLILILEKLRKIKRHL